VILYDFIKIN